MVDKPNAHMTTKTSLRGRAARRQRPTVTATQFASPWDEEHRARDRGVDLVTSPSKLHKCLQRQLTVVSTSRHKQLSLNKRQLETKELRVFLA